MGLAKRIIPCLDVDAGRVVKGIKFVDIKDAGDPVEAARAYGMPPAMIMRRITLPAMLPYAIPGLANLWLVTTKDTALLAVVGFTELTLATRQAAGVTHEYFLFFSAAGVLYLAVTLVSNVLLQILERRATRGMVRRRT